MNFNVIGIFNRSITIELENDNPYNLDSNYNVYVNGILKKTTNLNVTTIVGLEPDTDYVIGVEYDSDLVECEIKTRPEAYLLEVDSFGASGDGKHNDTAAIQAAISACPEGGTVHLGKGVYLSGPVFLKSHMTLWIDNGAVILGETDRNQYPILPGMIKTIYDDMEKSLGTWEGNPLDSYASLITGIDVEDVDIIGQGIIDGNAENSDWWNDFRVKRGAWRPKTIFLNNCKNIRIQNVRIQNSPSWTVHPYYCSKLGIYDMDVYNPDNSPNTDGFDPECCTDIEIIGTRISVGDDCIALKSGKLYMGMFHYKRTERVTVRNCRLERGHGAVTIGSEVSSGVADITVDKCLFCGTDRGLRIKTRRGRGEKSYVNNLNFQKIHMTDVLMPFTANMFYFCDPDGHTDYVQDQNPRPVDSKTPRIGNIAIHDIDCTGVNAVFACIYGLPEMPIEGIYLDNVNVSYKKQSDRTDVCPIMMDNFMTMNGKSMYFRNVKKVSMNNVTIKGSADTEPELINVTDKNIEGLLYT